MAHFDWDTGVWDSYTKTDYYAVYAGVWVLREDGENNNREAIRALLAESEKKMGRGWRGWTELDFDDEAGLFIGIDFEWSWDVEYFDSEDDDEIARKQQQEGAVEGVYEMMAALAPDGYKFEVDDDDVEIY